MHALTLSTPSSFRPRASGTRHPLSTLTAQLARTLAGTVLALATPLAWSAPAAVTVTNASTRTRCAEEDNVSFALAAPSLSALRIQALPPAFAAPGAQLEPSKADFSGCSFGKPGDPARHPTDPHFAFTPRKVTLYEGKHLAIVGTTFDSFWRPQRVSVTVAGRRDGGFHLLQFFHKSGTMREEYLALYPSDGYWRAKPLPLRKTGASDFGSSFLLGPIELDVRPVVTIEHIDISPADPTVKLVFAQGGSATLKVNEIDARRVTMDVRFDPAMRSTAPFAMLRSMFVSPDNADVSEVAWQMGTAAQSAALNDVITVQTTGVRFGRRVPSSHNMSAPDMVFDQFEAPGH